MENLDLFVGLLVCTILLAVFSERLKIPYPMLLLSVGISISLIPYLPNVQLDPNVVLLVFLPPLLYSAAWFTSWPDFLKAIRSISLLALGYILFSSYAIAYVASSIIPGFSMELGFLLGAILAPPDAVAAVSILRGKSLPKRLKTILEGESLVNDSTALIAYKFAIAAIATGTFSLAEASFQFVLVAGGGVLVGWVIALIMYRIHRIINNTPTVDTAMTFATPYISYLLAERFHFSGVLAVVTTGLWLSRKSSILFSHATRLQAVGAWKVLVFLLEGIIFLLIGLQINLVIAHFTADTLLFYMIIGLIISVCVVVFRLIWIFPGAYVPRMLSKRIREREPETNWKLVFIAGWTAIRGVVSLAAALALPISLPSGEPFPYREEILFITFCVIVFTLFVNGTMLPFLMKWFKITGDTGDDKHETEVKLNLTQKAIEHIEENLSLGHLSEEALALIKSKYEIKQAKLFSRHHPEHNKNSLERYDRNALSQYQDIQLELLRIERDNLLEMRKKGLIEDDAFRKIEAEVDLEESALFAQKGVIFNH